MSEPDTLAYMTDDFALPRWNTQQTHDGLSSSAQAAQSAAQASSYMFNPGPPPQSNTATTNRLQAMQQSSTAGGASSRQHRINQLLDEDQQYAVNPSAYSSSGASLSRSASYGGAVAGSRARRHHMSDDDLERAYNVDPASVSSSTNTQRQNTHHSQNSLYPPSNAYHPSPGLNAPPPSTGSPGSGTGDAYQDVYFSTGNMNSHPPKRSATTHDASTSSRAGRSPHRTVTGTNAAMLDPYSPHQQNQYNPPSSAYPYSPTAEQRSFAGGGYTSHSRSQSQTKLEPLTPPLPAYRSPYSVPKSETMDGQLPTTTTYSPANGPPSSSAYQSQYAMNSSSPAPSSSQNLGAAAARVGRGSSSQPPTPLSYGTAAQPPGPTHSPYYGDHQAMVVEPPPPPKRRASGLRRVRDQRDLRPYVSSGGPGGRRMDASGVYLSPVRQLTTNIVETYRICNPHFKYESTHNPRRVLTKPSKPSHNDGYDNEDYDYILYVNDWLGTDDGHKYLILDILGQGTFGQVVKCQNMKTHEVVAVKVVKNKPAYFNQSMMEVTILELLNNQCDPHDEHHILRLRDSFIHKNHLCLVFELLSSNLYELIKQNQFQGLSTQLVKVFTAQLLDALTVLKEARLIHCDLKPENILLKSLQSPQIKVIDFGSACHERQTVYTYIQSRFYRSPEVLLGIPYTAAIDMWSLGCIAVELFLGLPLFPGTSEYNQITRIVEMLGNPPQYMLDTGKQSSQFFDHYTDHYGQKKHKLKSIEQYSREHNTQEQPGKQYFKATTLPEIIQQAPMPAFKSNSRQAHEIEKEMNNRASFIDFCQGLLNMDPFQRWTPQQARLHPFITGEKWTKAWTPSGAAQQAAAAAATSPSPAADPKRPYGGLVQTPQKSTGAFRDAATYNQHLAQQQAYTAQQQAATQAAQNVYRNPYLQQQPSQSSPAQSQSSSNYNHQLAIPHSPSSYGSSHHGLARHSSHGHLNVTAANPPQYTTPGSFPVPAQQQVNAPSNTYHGGGNRARSNTINHMVDNIPPALARLQHMNQDVIGGRKALTPVLKRDDALREWERRQQGGKAAATQPYPQLELLQQQAEIAAAQGLANWATYNSAPQLPTRFQAPPSNLSHSYSNNMVVDDDRREAVMSTVRQAARSENGGQVLYGSNTSVIPSPPQAYASNSTTAGNRYAAAYPQQQTPTSPFDSLDRRPDMSGMYVPMQPDQYGPYNPANAQASNQSGSSRQVGPPAQAVPQSFYGANVVPAGQQQPGQRNPFSQADGLPSAMSTKEGRRKSGMDLWS